MSTINSAKSEMLGFYLVFLFGATLTRACVPLTGVDDNTPGAISSKNLIDFPEDGIYSAIFGGLIANGGGPLGKYETPIALRLPFYSQNVLYSTLAAYEADALDTFARKKESTRRRRCMPKTDDKEGVKLFGLHRRISLAYAFATAEGNFSKGAREKVYPVLEAWGLDPNVCEKVKCDERTPYGLAHVIKTELYEFSLRDGWNSDGSLSRMYNRIPYEDPRPKPYVPMNSPWALKSPKRWQPLLESNGLGFLYHQEHVVPHIGDTAKSLIFKDKDICRKKLPRQNYNFRREIKQLFERSRKLNDVKKAQIIIFDNKLSSLSPLMNEFYIKQNRSLDEFEIRSRITAFHTAMYESVIIAWREKVRQDLVRPPSIIRELLGKKLVTAYAGPNQGVKRIPADEWMPYIRTMPHAEFPSGSSCSCSTFAELLTELSGTDNILSLTNAPLTLTLKAGSATTEQNFPDKDITLKFDSWSSVAEACGVSRLDGGMHFTAAVPGGERICAGVGKRSAQFYSALRKGMVPEYVAPFSGPANVGKRC